MNELVESILSNTKKAYKESALIDNLVIQDLLLSVLADCSRLQDSIASKDVASNFVDDKDKKVFKPRERITLSDEKSRDINIIAYIFSKYEHTALFPNKNQTDAFKEISKLLDVKPTTFRNKRDAFDRFTNSTRAGWDKPLSESMQEIFDEYKSLSKENALDYAKAILDKHLL